MPKLYIHNTLSRKKEEFIPVDKNHIRMYTCGPTVYNYAHIGNARPAVVSDVLVRVLKQLYKKVTFVSNITDIDDKIIKASQESDVSIDEITKKYKKIYNDDMHSLGVIPPDIQPHATDYIDEMIELVQSMIDNDTAYESESHVLFDVTKYKAYGKLSGRDIDDQLAGSRVEVASYKRNPGDFVLWKPSTDDQPGWNSPWGFGRPGWHLECSTMSEQTLGLPFDIHGGGMDLTFPHHENEIAQSCGAHHENHDPQVFVKYWIHNAMLNINGEKMSKSLGNIFYIRDYLEKFDGEILRLALLSGHYRQSINWTDDTINQSKSTLDKFYRILNKVIDIEIKDEDLDKCPDSVLEAFCDDLNTSKAIAELNDIAKKLSKAETNDDKIKFKIQFLSAAKIFGILNHNPAKWLGIGLASESLAQDNIEQLIEERNQARKSKDFEKADQIRNQLSSMNIEIEDTPDGTIWRTK
ncbi:MAG: cysteine--tRNA ligase [Cytophagia bacterium]|nr:cysteine--tRNA ligase [Cytophagia bacterium]|tara:strand:+ start:169 stop:1569 length:1401 start_codon:yes stop_codon:yes gene_type:complete